MTEEEACKLAEEHWKFLEERYHQMFLDGWMHSWKHTMQEIKDGNRTEV